ncbi:hypothetical protein ACQGRJ_09780 [Bacillus atrophaeus]|uniref:hypothetical protein n=1 Tax=Bacillus atrophaeus TaxID=1452 RepID=UPI003CEBB92C
MIGLKQGQTLTEVLNSLPPILRVQYGLALQEEQEKEESPINDKSLAEAMLARLKDSFVKERLIKEIEEQRKQEEKEKATD